MKKHLLVPFIVLAMFTISGCETLNEIAGSLPNASNDPTTSEIIGGLKQALDKGVIGSVNILSKEGGYFNDPLVKIPFPEDAKFAADKLRTIGLGDLIDRFEKRLNEGAEKGAKTAVNIFKNAITSMTFQDAKGILLGGETAATNYFKNKTKQELYRAYSPQIKNTLDQVKATDIWGQITSKYNAIPFTQKKIETDLVKYATDKALDGLFVKIAEEEKKIRKNPVQRTTELLKKVFDFADRNK